MIAIAIGLALAVTSIASGFGDGRPAKGGARNPSSDVSKSYAREMQLIANVSTYGTRQSNKSARGGSAIYGCRSGAGGSPKGMRPCVRSNNLRAGLAFEFQTKGTVAGTINTARGGDGSAPFTTNATGVATGLNADRVDGQSAADIVNSAAALHPFVQVGANGQAGTWRGMPANGVTNPDGAGTYNVTFTGDLVRCALQATLTGVDAGQITVQPTLAADKKSTSIAVRTFNGSGTPDDRGFHLSASC